MCFSYKTHIFINISNITLIDHYQNIRAKVRLSGNVTSYTNSTVYNHFYFVLVNPEFLIAESQDRRKDTLRKIYTYTKR